MDYKVDGIKPKGRQAADSIAGDGYKNQRSMHLNDEDAVVYSQRRSEKLALVIVIEQV